MSKRSDRPYPSWQASIRGAPFLELSQFLEKLPVQAVAAGARNNGSPSDFFVRHNGERGCEMGAEFLSQCFRYEPNKLGG